MKLPLRLRGSPWLSTESEQVLRLLAAGATLKTHRCLDGDKTIRLHPLNGPAVAVSARAMEQLREQRLLESNMKFPAATYLLSERGRQAARVLAE